MAVLPSSAFGGGNIFFLHLPPSPPPHLLLLPLLLRTTEVPRVRHSLTTTWLPPPPPLPSPPPTGRAQSTPGERGGAHRGAAPRCGFGRFSRALHAGQLEHCACARSLRSRVSAVPSACAPPPSPCGLAAGSDIGAVPGGSARRARASREWCFRSTLLRSLCYRVGPQLLNSLTLSFLGHSSLFSLNCAVSASSLVVYSQFAFRVLAFTRMAQ